MAKVTSLIELQGTYDGVTYVKSRTYGNHLRAKRGTHKPAVLNEAYQKQKEKLVRSNVPAKIIKDAIDPYRKDFYDGSLWRRLVSRTTRQGADDELFDFSRMRPFEFHEKYELARLFDLRTSTTLYRERSELQVDLSYNLHPMFSPSLFVDGYRFQVIAIFPIANSAKSDAIQSDIIDMEGKIERVGVKFSVPSDATVFLICVRVDGCEMGKPYGTLGSKGMKMVQAGRI